jgi:hypothetical protein
MYNELERCVLASLEILSRPLSVRPEDAKERSEDSLFWSKL